MKYNQVQVPKQFIKGKSQDTRTAIETARQLPDEKSENN